MDINCDLGEGEPLRRTRALLARVTSANIACGGHAGDAASMRRCLRLCREQGVQPGAHPGFEDRENFGRKAHPLTPAELELLLTRQVEALAALAREEGAPLTHIKLHGALYHVTEHDPALARAFVDFVRQHYPALRIVAQAEGTVIQEARRQNREAWGEIFAERGYQADGRLVPRDQPGAVIDDLRIIRARAREFRESGLLRTQDGQPLKIEAQTICVHADTPGAVRIAGVLAEVFRR